ncbi:MAG: hypothetical protein QG673_1720 [Pseudomonadota bacterium]|nr:hypothetical protein [Pseudomonadota bacterium]
MLLILKKCRYLLEEGNRMPASVNNLKLSKVVFNKLVKLQNPSKASSKEGVSEPQPDAVDIFVTAGLNNAGGGVLPLNYDKLLESIKKNLINTSSTPEQPGTTEITFVTSSAKKEHFISAIIVGLMRLPELPANQQDIDVKYAKKMVGSFTIKDNPKYLSDLQTACEYLLEHDAKRQGGEELHKFMHLALCIFELIEDAKKIMDKNNGSITQAQLNEIKKKCEEQIKGFSNSGSRYGFKAAACGALIGAVSAGGVVAGGAAGLSFLAGTIASLQSIATALLAALGIAAVGGAALTAATIALPVTAGLVLGAATGLTLYKGYKYYNYANSEKRLNNQTQDNSRTSAVSGSDCSRDTLNDGVGVADDDSSSGSDHSPHYYANSEKRLNNQAQDNLGTRVVSGSDCSRDTLNDGVSVADDHSPSGSDHSPHDQTDASSEVDSHNLASKDEDGTATTEEGCERSQQEVISTNSEYKQVIYTVNDELKPIFGVDTLTLDNLDGALSHAKDNFYNLVSKWDDITKLINLKLLKNEIADIEKHFNQQQVNQQPIQWDDQKFLLYTLKGMVLSQLGGAGVVCVPNYTNKETTIAELTYRINYQLLYSVGDTFDKYKLQDQYVTRDEMSIIIDNMNAQTPLKILKRGVGHSGLSNMSHTVVRIKDTDQSKKIKKYLIKSIIKNGVIDRTTGKTKISHPGKKEGGFKIVKTCAIEVTREEDGSYTAMRNATVSGIKYNNMLVKNNGIDSNKLARDGFTEVKFTNYNKAERIIYRQNYLGETLCDIDLDTKSAISVVKQFILMLKDNPTKYYDIKLNNLIYDRLTGNVHVIDYLSYLFTMTTKNSTRNGVYRDVKNQENDLEVLQQQIFGFALVCYQLFQPYNERTVKGATFGELKPDKLELLISNPFSGLLQRAYKGEIKKGNNENPMSEFIKKLEKVLAKIEATI